MKKILGMFLAVPIAAIIKIITMNWLGEDTTPIIESPIEVEMTDINDGI